jgi:4-hydroxy-2-oxoheptanedioate aldolase
MAPTRTRNQFKAALGTGKKQIGFWLTLASPTATEIAAEAGFDWLLIDMEHAPNDVADVVHHLRATGRGTAEPVVRAPVLDSTIVKRLLDAGVRSFMFPNIETVAQAELAVAATRYPPRGVRGVSATTRGAGYGRWPDYFKTAEDDICVLLQLETVAGIDAASEIAAVDGVDVLFIGPSDLSASMGHIGNPTAPAVQERIRTGLAAIKAAGVASGTLNFTFDAAVKQFGEGFDIIAVGGDGSLLTRQTNEMVSKFVAALAEASPQEGKGA